MIKEWLRRIRDYPALAQSNEAYAKLLEKEKEKTHNLLEENTELVKQIVELVGKQELEEYWNNKRQKKLITWHARDGVKMDVRCFFQTDETLPKFIGIADEVVADTLAWAVLIVHYRAEKGEFWQYAYETMLTKTGDCEDGAILMANILMNSGVPYWRIRLNKGKVKLPDGKNGYHCWLTYLAEKDNIWRMIDWCYWPEESRDLKLNWKDAEKYFEPDASWNSKYSFSGLTKVS